MWVKDPEYDPRVSEEDCLSDESVIHMCPQHTVYAESV